MGMPLMTLLLCLLILTIQVGSECKKKVFNLFNPKYVFELYYILILPLSNFLVSFFDIQETDVRVSNISRNFDQFRISIYILLGFFCFVVGAQSVSRFRFNRWRILDKPWKRSRVKPLIFALIVIGYGCFFLMVRRNGGLSAFLENIQTFRNTGLIGQGFLLYPATDLLTMCFIIYMVTRNKENHSVMSKIKFFFFLLVCIFPSLLTGFRGKALCAVFEVVAIHYMYERKISLTKLVIIGFFFVFAFTAYGILREMTSSTSVTASSLIKEKPELVYSALLRIKGGEVLGVVINQLDITHDYQFGYKTIIEALTIIIPHAIWPGKPEAKSIVFSETFFGLNGGVSPSIITELYWDFGIVGITLGMLFFGMMFTLIYNTVTAKEANSSKVLFSGLFFIGFMFAESISGTLNGLVTYIIFFVIVINLLTIKVNECSSVRN